MKRRRLLASAILFLLAPARPAGAETLRLLTWEGYAPPEVVDMFETENPEIDVEVTLSNNEDMVARLAASAGRGFDLAQPSHDRLFAAQLEHAIYKPLDLARLDLSELDPDLLAAVRANTTIEGRTFAVPHLWGTAGLMGDVTKVPDARSWADLCDPAHGGRTAVRLRRILLLGTAFSLGYDPFALYDDPPAYEAMLDRVGEHLIACKNRIGHVWEDAEELGALMLSGRIVLADTWDTTAFKLYAKNRRIVFIPPETGALAWIDTFALPAGGQADDAAYKWIGFVTRPEIAALVSRSSGAVAAVRNGIAYLPPDKRDAFREAFEEEDLQKIRFFAKVPPGIEAMEQKVLTHVRRVLEGDPDPSAPKSGALISVDDRL